VQKLDCLLCSIPAANVFVSAPGLLLDDYANGRDFMQYNLFARLLSISSFPDALDLQTYGKHFGNITQANQRQMVNDSKVL